MATLTESVRTGEFLVSESNNTQSREQVKLAPDMTLKAGTVLGKSSLDDTYWPLDVNAEDGSQQPAGILYRDTITDSNGGEAVIIAWGAEVDKQLLIWPEGMTEWHVKNALFDLSQRGIALR